MRQTSIGRRGFLGGAAAGLIAPGNIPAASPVKKFRIDLIELYVRVTPPGRLAVAIGRNLGEKPKPERNPIVHARMVLRDARGNTAYGCSGDRMSVRWLDKRLGRSKSLKLRELVGLIETARKIYLAEPGFNDPFTKWLECYRQIHAAGRKAKQEDLTSAFASALIERAMLDALCRLAQQPIFNMARRNQLGFDAGAVLPELKGVALHDHLAERPRTKLHIRHTVGKVDPLTAADIAPGERLSDGLPQTLEEYVRINGITKFKLKASGDVRFDLARMQAIAKVLPRGGDTLITVDANEAYSDLTQLEKFVDALADKAPFLYERLAYIEQPLPRALTLDKKTAPAIRRIAAKKPLIIDEADGTLTAFRQAREMGYSGCSHKNCKGFYKSLLNLSLVKHFAAGGEKLLLSGEDLQNMPIAPLHQDFATVSLLGLEHCERNGHHFNYGLCMVSDRERRLAEKRHSDMYFKRDGELFLKIERGMVDVGSLQCPGFGVCFEPDWRTMQPMRRWLRSFSP